MATTPAWQRKAGKNPKGGLNARGRASAKAQGMNLKPPVKAAQAKKSPKSALPVILALPVNTIISSTKCCICS